MCNPLLMTIGMSAVQYIGGQQAAEGQYKAAKEAAAIENQALTERQRQVNDASALEQSEVVKQGMVERAKIATIAGEAGAMGLSSDRLLGDSFMQQGLDISSMETNRQNEVKNLSSKQQTNQAKGQALTNQAYAQAPTLIGTGLQIGGEVYKAKEIAEAKAKAKSGVVT